MIVECGRTLHAPGTQLTGAGCCQICAGDLSGTFHLPAQNIMGSSECRGEGATSRQALLKRQRAKPPGLPKVSGIASGYWASARSYALNVGQWCARGYRRQNASGHTLGRRHSSRNRMSGIASDSKVGRRMKIQARPPRRERLLATYPQAEAQAKAAAVGFGGRGSRFLAGFLTSRDPLRRRLSNCSSARRK